MTSRCLDLCVCSHLQQKKLLSQGTWLSDSENQLIFNPLLGSREGIINLKEGLGLQENQVKRQSWLQERQCLRAPW